MAEGDLTREQAYKRQWFFDWLINFYDRYIEARKNSRDLQYRVKRELTGPGSEEVHRAANMIIEQAEGDMHDFGRIKNDILEHRIMLVGPATVESLVNHKPESYDYLLNGRIPFNKIFFEFSEPFMMNLPIINQKKKLCAMELEGGPITSGEWRYSLISHYSDNPGDLINCSMELVPSPKAEFGGIVMELSNRLKSEQTYLEAWRKTLRKGKSTGFPQKPLYRNYSFRINFDSKTGWITNRTGMEEEVEMVTPENLGSEEAFYQVPNLCINLVNYINSHNTTVVPRTTPIRRCQNTHNQDGKRTFYLVAVKDRVVQEYEPRDEPLWHLQERIVVRGNIKKRLDEAGNIIKTYWQPPHIKGPKDAPFRDQRYQVLADKIKREQELYHQFGIKNDPSLWMEEDEIVISSKTSSAQNSSRLQEVYKSVRDYISKQYHTLKARIAFYISKEA